MAEKETGVRLFRDISPGFEAHHSDANFDWYLDEFFKDGKFPATNERKLNSLDPKQKRIKKLLRLESNATGRQFCTELRDAIRTHFKAETGQKILLEAMKFMLRIHIDDKDRSDTELPGVSHQMKVAKNVLDVLVKKEPLDRYDATIFAAAMLHDVVEDHSRLLLLEQKKLNNFYKMIGADGNPVLRESDSTKKKIVTLLAYESGEERKDKEGNIIVVPNNFMKKIITLVTRDRVEMFETWKGMSHEEATEAEKRLLVKKEEVSPEGYVANQEQKQEFYELYALDTFTDPKKAGEAASLIKIMDLRDNALTVGRIRERAEKTNDRTLYSKYEGLKKKYENVLVDLYIALPGWPENTWVGSMRHELREEIGAVLATEYGKSLDSLS